MLNRNEQKSGPPASKRFKVFLGILIGVAAAIGIFEIIVCAMTGM